MSLVQSHLKQLSDAKLSDIEKEVLRDRDRFHADWLEADSDLFLIKREQQERKARGVVHD